MRADPASANFLQRHFPASLAHEVSEWCRRLVDEYGDVSAALHAARGRPAVFHVCPDLRSRSRCHVLSLEQLAHMRSHDRTSSIILDLDRCIMRLRGSVRPPDRRTKSIWHGLNLFPHSVQGFDFSSSSMSLASNLRRAVRVAFCFLMSIYVTCRIQSVVNERLK